jgi:hypothetical protein
VTDSVQILPRLSSMIWCYSVSILKILLNNLQKMIGIRIKEWQQWSWSWYYMLHMEQSRLHTTSSHFISRRIRQYFWGCRTRYRWSKCNIHKRIKHVSQTKSDKMKIFCKNTEVGEIFQ